MLEPRPTQAVLRLLLSGALFFLPLVAVFHRAAQGNGDLGMGTRLPVALETVGKRFGLSAPSQARPGGVSFEVALLGASAVLWRLVGRFLQAAPADVARDLLISFGTLQLEGG